MTVLGKRRANFKPANSDQTIEGWFLYVGSKNDKTEGYECERIFVTDKKFVNGDIPNLNDEIRITYNKFGKVEDCYVL